MTIDLSQIVADKLADLEKSGAIKKHIEDTLEKSIMDAITDALGGYSFKRDISKQVEENIHGITADCGFSAYNGFIAERVKSILMELYTKDIAEKVSSALDDAMLKKHENVKLSDIFKMYREWVCGYMEESEKYDLQNFHCALNEDDGSYGIHRIIATFADHELKAKSYGSGYEEEPDITVVISTGWSGKVSGKISTLLLNGHNMRETLRIGTLTNFEAFLVNLYYNGTPILLDMDDVDEDNSFDIDI